MTEVATLRGPELSSRYRSPRAEIAGTSLRATLIRVGLGLYLALLLALRVPGWGSPATQAWTADLSVFLPGLPCVVLFWFASRRSGDRRTASAWRWLTLSVLFLVATFGLTLSYQLVTGAVPFPSAVDACYLAFYGCFLIGLLRFPKRRESWSGRVRLSLDVATVIVAGGTLIWFLALGEAVHGGARDLLQGVLAAAYPIGDVLQLFGLVYAITRVANASTRRALRLLAAGTSVALVGDALHSRLLVHGSPALSIGIELAFVAAWALFLVASGAQQPVAGLVEERDTRPRDRWLGWAAFLYVAPASVFALLVHAELHGSLSDRIALSVATGIVSLLVIVRQLIARRDLVAAQRELRHQALHDALTGLANRTCVFNRAEQLMARAQSTQSSTAALFIDLDGFEDVNESFGHAIGDALLQTVAARLTAGLTDVDTVGRMGGDTFAILLEPLAGSVDAELVAERVLDIVREPIDLEGTALGRPLSITASVGIAVRDGASADSLLQAANLALYEAKNTGKNRCVRFEPNMQTVAQERLLLALDLRDAVANDELFLLYQPTVDLETRSIRGVEALIRWRHPVRGVVGPDQFIPLAEATGAIVAIGRWVLHNACKQAAEWHRQGHPLSVAINVSPLQLEDEQFVAELERELGKHDLEPAALTLEITETMLMRRPDEIAGTLRELKALGVRIAIDDFGTGYSSLAYLQKFEVDMLKIDRSFIQSISATKDSAALVQALVQLGKALDLETVGEGIEDESQLQALRAAHCDLGQGYLIARPLAPPAIGALLQSQTAAAWVAA